MGWTKSVKISDGILSGRVFDTNIGSMSDMTFTAYPDPQNPLLVETDGERVLFADIEIYTSQIWGNLPMASTVLFWAIEINQDAYYKVELRCNIRKTGAYNAELIPYLRIYTDASTYSDNYNINQLAQSPTFVSLHSSNYSYPVNAYAFFAFTEYSGESYVYFGISEDAFFTLPQTHTYYAVGRSVNYFDFVSLINGNIPAEEKSDEFGDASEPEGYDTTGGFDDSSDVISIPSKPQSVLSLGFVNVYKCDAGALSQFGEALFPEIQFPTSLSQVGEVLAAVSDSIWNSKLIDYVISVHCVPGNIPAGALTDIKVGARTMTGIMGRPISNEYVDFDFGSISLDPYYKNYADDMTEIQLYLPFYGFVSLRPEEVIRGTINVTYRFNVIDGSFTAFVLSTSGRSKLSNSVIGQYGGSCVIHLPVSNISYASMFSSLIGASAGAAMGVATGGAGAAVAASLTASNGIISAAQGGDSKKSNSYNASSSFMTRRKPYLIVTRPISSFSTRYNIENGLPSNVAMTLGSCRGFTTAENAILDGIPCTQEEKQRLQGYLKSGIIIK